MKRARFLDALRGWLRSPRRRLLAGGLALAAAAAIAAVIYFLALGGGGPAAQSPPSLRECDVPNAIDPLPTGGPDDWQRLTLPPLNDCFHLVASDSDATGVVLGSAFVLEAQEPIVIASLVSRLQVEPALEFDVEAVAEGAASLQPNAPAAAGARYRIVPNTPLSEDTLYRFTLLDEPGGLPIRSWAFQTQRPLRVVQTLPADQSTSVPLSIGIELTFSQEGVTGVEEHFRIDPPVPGRFETHKRTVVFVPQELQPQTLYTATLGAGIGGSGQSLGEDFTFRFETGSGERTGEAPGGPALQFSRRVWESSTQETPAMSLFGTALQPDSTGGITLPFTVYRFPGLDAFLASLDQFTALPDWARAARDRFQVDASSLEAVTSFEAPLQRLGQSGDAFVRFPEPLPQGYYLVEAKFQDRILQAWLQATDVATYVSLSDSRTLLWANDVAAKAPLIGAAVRAVGTDFTTTTGRDGVASFDTPPGLVRLQPSPFGYTTTQTVGNLVVTAPDGRTAVVPLAEIFSGFRYFGFREYGFAGDPGLYWRFLYSDRHLYRPTDTVHFWGLVRLRDNPPPAQDVVVEVSGYQYSDTGFYQPGRPISIARTTVTTSAMGTFIGQLSLKGVSPGFYDLRTRMGDQVIASTYLEVQDFIKPAYKIDVLPSRKAIYAGESVDFTVEASFFDGSPVPNAELNYSGAASGTLTTDAAGRAVVPFSGQIAGSLDGPFNLVQFNVAPVRAEEGEITGSGWVQVFPAGLTIDATSRFSAGAVTVSGTVHNVDLDRMNSDEASDFFAYRGSPAAGRQVAADVVEQSYNRIETGDTYYDFIAKIVRKEYRYEPVRTPIGQFSASSDAQGRFTISFPAAKDKSYEVTLRVSDDAGRTFSSQVYAYSGADFFSDFPSLALDPPGPFAVGDQVTVTMRQGGQDLPAGGDNRYLFYRAQNVIRDYAIQDGPTYSFTFAQEHIPNIDVIAVRFTGATYQELPYPQTARFDQSLRRLTVAVQPGQERYRPGDKATLNVTVSDKDGRPVQAEVLLSAVDEAIYRLQGQSFFDDLGILDALYQPVRSGVLKTYASHQYPAQSGAERGGGGGARDNFKDVALFERVTTDGGGRASITFDLPDNLTSWRVSGLAVTQDLYAGSGVSLVPVGLPLFVDVTMNTSYLTGDRPSIKLRAFGEALAAGDPVAFEVTSPTLLDQPLTASGAAFTALDVPLPPLRDGRHELTIKASARGLEDALVRTVTVVPSRLLRSEARFYQLQPGGSQTLEGTPDRPTRVLITDHNHGRYYPALLSLSWTYGDRVDQMLARNLAQDLLAQYFQEDADFPAEFRPSAYQTTGGGIAIFPFADADLTLSARIAALAPDSFGRQALTHYFQKVLDDPQETRERNIIALYGLAALGEPVLSSVQALAALGDLSVRERLYLGLAAAQVGDQDTAGAVYRRLLEEFGQRRGPSVRLNVGVDQDDILEATSLAAVLGAALGDDFAPLLFDYSSNNFTKDILVSLEQISYLTQALPNLSAAPVRFAYSLQGRRTEGELDRGRSLALLLAPDELRHLDLQAVEGSLGVVTTFLAPFEPASVQPDPALTIRRSYQGQPPDAATIQEGELVRITIDYNLGPQALDGCYQVSDLLPSGLRPVTRLYQWGIRDTTVTYPYNIEGQRVSFCVYKSGLQQPLVYYARVVGKGAYSAEPALIQSQKAPESINLTGPLSIDIR